MPHLLNNSLLVADGDGGSSPPTMPNQPDKRRIDELDAVLELLPSIPDQIAMYRVGEFDALAKSANVGLSNLLEPDPDTPVWQLRLLSLDEEERHRISHVCDIIDAANDGSRSAVAGTLRDSIVRNGTELISSDDLASIPPVLVRFAIFFMVEKLRCGGLSREDAIDCVSRMNTRDVRFRTPSTATITAWYDKKSGIEYTGVKQLAELIACEPQKYVFPIWAAALRGLRANLDLIKRLVDLDVLSDVEKAKLKKTARWLLRMAKVFDRIFCKTRYALKENRIEKRMASLHSDQILRDVLPVLFQRRYCHVWAKDPDNSPQFDLFGKCGFSVNAQKTAL